MTVVVCGAVSAPEAAAIPAQRKIPSFLVSDVSKIIESRNGDALFHWDDAL
jgi:hypothetical protein